MPIQYLAKRVKKFFVYRVLSLDDTPHRIALGVAIGIFVTWTPTIGLQMALTIALSLLLRANKFVGVPFVWLSNPFTLVPVYGPNYMVGSWILGGNYTWSTFTNAIAEATACEGGWWATTCAWLNATMSIFAPLWLGSIIVGLALALISYPAIYWGVVAYRRHKRLTHLADTEQNKNPQ